MLSVAVYVVHNLYIESVNFTYGKWPTDPYQCQIGKFYTNSTLLLCKLVSVDLQQPACGQNCNIYICLTIGALDLVQSFRPYFGLGVILLWSREQGVKAPLPELVFLCLPRPKSATWVLQLLSSGSWETCVIVFLLGCQSRDGWGNCWCTRSIRAHA